MLDTDNVSESTDLHVSVCEEDMTVHNLQVTTTENDTRNNSVPVGGTSSSSNAESSGGDNEQCSQDSEMEEASSESDHAISESNPEPRPNINAK